MIRRIASSMTFDTKWFKFSMKGVPKWYCLFIIIPIAFLIICMGIRIVNHGKTMARIEECLATGAPLTEADHKIFEELPIPEQTTLKARARRRYDEMHERGVPVE